MLGLRPNPGRVSEHRLASLVMQPTLPKEAAVRFGTGEGNRAPLPPQLRCAVSSSRMRMSTAVAVSDAMNGLRSTSSMAG